jgi:hypothetical protein
VESRVETTGDERERQEIKESSCHGCGYRQQVQQEGKLGQSEVTIQASFEECDLREANLLYAKG